MRRNISRGVHPVGVPSDCIGKRVACLTAPLQAPIGRPPAHIRSASPRRPSQDSWHALEAWAVQSNDG
eukprot:5893339-Alexandrium_andersonii.AAC.1